MQQTYDLDVRWRAFPLHPDTPEEGQLLEDLFRTDSQQISKMVEKLRLTAEELDLPFGPRTRTYNSRLAQELGLWAEDQGQGHSFHMAAFRAYFVSGLNLAEQRVLLDLAKQAGLEESAAEAVLRERTCAARVDRDWEDSRLMGITAVPTFVMGQHKLVGAQSFENLCRLVEHYGAVPR